MPLRITDPEAERLARELARLTGESLSQAVTNALRERLVRVTTRSTDTDNWLERLRQIQHEVAQLPVRDDRPSDDLLGYNETGLTD